MKGTGLCVITFHHEMGSEILAQKNNYAASVDGSVSEAIRAKGCVVFRMKCDHAVRGNKAIKEFIVSG